jgi:hypothetical protein
MGACPIGLIRVLTRERLIGEDRQVSADFEAGMLARGLSSIREMQNNK